LLGLQSYFSSIERDSHPRFLLPLTISLISLDGRPMCRAKIMISETAPAGSEDRRRLLQMLALVGVIVSSATFIFCVYVAFTLCGYCLTNPHAPSPNRLPWETHRSGYWDIDGVYATVAFVAILTCFFVYDSLRIHQARSFRGSLARSLLKTACIGSALVVLYEISLTVFDPKNFNNRITNYQPNYTLIKWVTNKDLLIISLFWLASLTFCGSLSNWFYSKRAIS